MDTTTSHTPTKRVEDDYLLRGAGRFMADAPLPGQTYACFVRSPHACADIKSIDTKAALAIKGVVAVITMAEIKAANVGNLSQHPPLPGRGGSKLVMPFRPALAGERTRHIGEPIAMVIGETTAARRTAPRRSRSTTSRTILSPISAKQPSPVRRRCGRRRPATSRSIGPDLPPIRRDGGQGRRRLKSAKHIARVSLVHQRINVASMEPRGATASHVRRTTATCCACARRAHAPCAIPWPA